MNHMSDATQLTMMAMHIAIIVGVAYRIVRGEQSHALMKDNHRILKNGNKEHL